MKKLLIATMMICGSSAAIAADIYAGVGVSRLSIDAENITLNPTAITATAGVQLHPNFAVEGRLSTGIASADVIYNGTKVAIDLDHAVGVYAKAILPVNDQFSVYGMGGYTTAALKATVGNLSATSENENSASYGLGADFKINKNIGVNVEYARMFKDTTAISAGLTYKF